MKRTSMYTAVLALSLAMALAGGGLACRTFRERLDALEEQAVLQHQRNVCGLEDAFAADMRADNFTAISPDSPSVCGCGWGDAVYAAPSPRSAGYVHV